MREDSQERGAKEAGLGREVFEQGCGGLIWCLFQPNPTGSLEPDLYHRVGSSRGQERVGQCHRSLVGLPGLRQGWGFDLWNEVASFGCNSLRQ